MDDEGREFALTWPEAYAKKQSPAEKHATDMTRNTSGERLIQMRTHQGTRSPGERYMACFQVSPKRLFTAAAILNTREANQKQLTAVESLLFSNSYENCKVVAVTAEKNVATVERLSKLVAPCFCANRIIGTPGQLLRAEL